jgi:hypothetical protein
MRKALRVTAVLATFGVIAWIGEVARSEIERPSPVDLDDHVPGSPGQRGRRGHQQRSRARERPDYVGGNPMAEDDQKNDDEDENDGEGEDNDEQGENHDAW